MFLLQPYLVLQVYVDRSAPFSVELRCAPLWQDVLALMREAASIWARALVLSKRAERCLESLHNELECTQRAYSGKRFSQPWMPGVLASDLVSSGALCAYGRAHDFADL